MPTEDDLKLRQMIFDEWDAETSVEDAMTKIQEKLVNKADITENKMNYWYRRFNRGDTSLFSTKSSRNVSIQGSSSSSSAKNSVNSILVNINDKYLKKPVFIDDGRLGILTQKQKMKEVANLSHFIKFQHFVTADKFFTGA